MSQHSGFLRRLRLRHVVFLALLLAGIIPLAVSSYLLIFQNRSLIQNQKEEELLQSARSSSGEVHQHLAKVRRTLEQLGSQLVALKPPGQPIARRVQSPQVLAYLDPFRQENDLLGIALAPALGRGPQGLGKTVSDSAREAFGAVQSDFMAQETPTPVFRFIEDGGQGTPAVALAVPILDGRERLQLLVVGLAKLDFLEDLFPSEVEDGVEMFLIGSEEELLWSAGVTPEKVDAFVRSGYLARYANSPVDMSTLVDAPDGTAMSILVGRIEESGWTVLVQRPAALAFEEVGQLVSKTILSSVILVLLALLLSLLAARQVSQPIQKLAQTSHEIADGNFGHRVETQGLLFELAELGEDFNRMSAHVERYIEELRRAAQANRDLFIGSLRAFVAAIDAKDPYTRGHSERVAKVARTVARFLGQTPEQQERIWIAALLHDVGKIGVEDRVLQKVGRLTDEEFTLMKLHPVIGAEIVAPIEQLKHAIPVIRWHHENWNGRGYPDQLRGEEIPLEARIVAVADTFDAITTNRPYQQAFTLEFAVETITKLTGKRFDAKVSTAFLNAYENGEITVVTPTLDGEKERSPLEVEKRVRSMS